MSSASNTPSCLNPFLLARLRQLSPTVRVSNPGVPAEIKTELTEGADGRYRQRKKFVTRGEQYAINCPNCGDTRQRLSINHQWGLDVEQRDPMKWALHCFNQECQSDPEFRQRFYDLVYSASCDEDFQPGELIIQRPVSVTPGQVRNPGPLRRVDELWENNRTHHAVGFLLDRMISPTLVGKYYGVGYCPISRMPLVTDRLVIPIKMASKLVGWTARFLGEPPAGTPKYYHMPGLQTGQLLYNYDVARHQQTKVIVEGVFDVFGVGPCGMALLGSSMSDEQLRLLRESFDPDRDVVVIMLDPAPPKPINGKVVQHHLERAYAKVISDRHFRGRVVKVYLPEWMDPGFADRDFSWMLIDRAAREKGLVATLVDEPEAFAIEGK